MILPLRSASLSLGPVVMQELPFSPSIFHLWHHLDNIPLPENLFPCAPPPVPQPNPHKAPVKHHTKINQSLNSAHTVSGSSSHSHSMEGDRLFLKIDFERFSLIVRSVGQEIVQICEYYFHPEFRTQHILLNNSLQAPISGADYAPEHLIKPLTLWYPSNPDTCEPLSRLSTMTRLARLEKGQILGLQASNTAKNGKNAAWRRNV